LAYWSKHAVTLSARNEIAQELRERGSKCPACAEQDRQNRRHWSALALAFVVAGLLLWRCSGG
jgi:hypothetical protein